ncbi:hypothetical protein HY522_02835 [bacterium]|nr:hypothetical protein [bacterium]
MAWIVPFLCLTISPAMLALTALVNVSYAGFIDSREIVWLTGAEWGIVFFLLVRRIHPDSYSDESRWPPDRTDGGLCDVRPYDLVSETHVINGGGSIPP